MSIEMDVYFLLRYLHSYDVNKMNRGHKGCKDIKYTQAINSIVYSGSVHTKFYTQFFKYYYQVEAEIEIFQEGDKQCIILAEYFDYYKYKYFIKKNIKELHR
jgi:hypothetical protein